MPTDWKSAGLNFGSTLGKTQDRMTGDREGNPEIWS